jgi:hypothetical protein
MIHKMEGIQMKLFKLTDQNGYTRKGQQGETKWSDGFRLGLPEKINPQLCTSDIIHAYKNINLALLLNPNHADIVNPQIWEAEGEIAVEDYGKVGCFGLTTIKKLPIPEWYTDEERRKRVCTLFAVLCAEAVLKYYEEKYPDDKRPRKAIEAARKYLKTKTASAASAARTAASAAASAARTAAYAAASAASAARTAASAAASAAYAAASAAAYAAAAEAYEVRALDLCAIADKAVEGNI